MVILTEIGKPNIRHESMSGRANQGEPYEQCMQRMAMHAACFFITSQEVTSPEYRAAAPKNLPRTFQQKKSTSAISQHLHTELINARCACACMYVRRHVRVRVHACTCEDVRVHSTHIRACRHSPMNTRSHPWLHSKHASP